MNGTNILQTEMKKTEHEFIIATPQGPARMTVPDEEMKVCPCGCDLFRLLNKVAYVKPSGVIGAKPMCLRVEVYVCNKCGTAIGPETHNKRVAAGG